MDEQAKIKILDYATDYLFGSLWWGAEQFIKDRFEDWKPPKDGRERKCHPLLSRREERVTAMVDTIIMLAGSRVKSRRDEKSNLVILMDDSQPQKKTVFCRDTISYLVFANDILYHEETEDINNDPETPLWERRRMWPNFVKPRLTERENAQFRAFIERWERIAMENGECKND